MVDAEKVKREESAYKKIPVITNFTDEDGNDRMKETVQANYRRIKEEVKQIVQEELERIKTIRCCVNCYQIMRLSNKSPKLKIIPIEV